MQRPQTGIAASHFKCLVRHSVQAKRAGARDFAPTLVWFSGGLYAFSELNAEGGYCIDSDIEDDDSNSLWEDVR